MIVNKKSLPWSPFREPPFYFLINDNGVPVYEFPRSTNNNTDNKTLLISGMLSAVNSIARELSGDNINNLRFGDYFLTVSKAHDSNRLFIFMFSNKYYDTIEKALEIHIEFVSLLQIHGISNLFDDTNNIDEEKVINIIEPFYRLKIKELKNNLKK